VREQWDEASRRFLGGLLREQDDDETAAWQQLVSIVADAAAAYGVAITVVDRDDPTTVVIPASVGGMESWSGRRIPRTNSITHAVVASGRPLIIADAATDPRTVGVASRAPEVGPVAAAPVIDGAGGTLEAALIVARTHNQEPFDPVEGELVAGFAVEAGAALALVRARRDRARLRRFEERERLASELNQRTLRRLIGVELALSGLLAESPTGDHRRRLSRQFDEVSNLVKDMRRVVFEAANHLDPLE
jgi:GAF domain-containing protein